MTAFTTLVAGRYRLVRAIGSGGMGRVWLARDEILHREVAVKEIVLPAGLTLEERDELRRRTLREAQAAAQLNHPNIVQVYDVLNVRGDPWIVMEYVPARSLDELVRRNGPLPPDRVARIGLALVNALQVAHAAGVLHRDVKPANVLVTEDDRVVIGDFGLATFEGGDPLVTRPGMVLGSPEYIAPERARDGMSTVESDLWSLGATLYAAVEGCSPYGRGSAMATLQALATEKPRPPQRAGPLEPLLRGLLRRNPRSRLTADGARRVLEVMVERGRPRRMARQRGRDHPVDAVAPTQRQPLPATRQVTVVTGRPRRATGRWLIGLATLALLIAGGTVVAAEALQRNGGGNRSSGSTPTPTPSATRSPAELSALGLLPHVRDANPAAATPVPSRPPNADEYALVQGWTWYHHPGGFRIATPVGWLRSDDGQTVVFSEPAGKRVLGVARLATPPVDPVADALAGEQRRVAAAGLLNYSRISIQSCNYYPPCAQWEYTYEGPGGVRLHAVNRTFRPTNATGYEVMWQTAEFDWPANTTYLSLVNASFRG